MKPMLKPPGTKHLKLKCDILLSTFAFKSNLRRYTAVHDMLVMAFGLLLVGIFTWQGGRSEHAFHRLLSKKSRYQPAGLLARARVNAHRMVWASAGHHEPSRRDFSSILSECKSS